MFVKSSQTHCITHAREHRPAPREVMAGEETITKPMLLLLPLLLLHAPPKLTGVHAMGAPFGSDESAGHMKWISKHWTAV